MWAALKLIPLGSKIMGAVAILIALIGIVGGAYYGGYSKGKAISKVEISKYETKVAELNTKLITAQGKVTTDVVTKYRDRVKTVTVTQVKNHDIIVNSVPNTFNLSRGFVYSYNQSVRGLDITAGLASDKTPTSTSDAAGLAIIDRNNDVAIHNADQLAALQEWVRKQEQVNEEVGHSGSANSSSMQSPK